MLKIKHKKFLVLQTSLLLFSNIIAAFGSNIFTLSELNQNTKRKDENIYKCIKDVSDRLFGSDFFKEKKVGRRKLIGKFNEE